jgi:cell division protein FtsN
MKRLFFIIIFASFAAAYSVGQARLGDFTIRGAASQEMMAEGLVGAHPSLPLNSRVKITNPRNGREIDITITDRIDPSLNRIVDLSSAAINALNMRAGEQVVLTVSAPPRPVSQVPRQPEQIIDLFEPTITAQAERQAVDEQPVVPVLAPAAQITAPAQVERVYVPERERVVEQVHVVEQPRVQNQQIDGSSRELTGELLEAFQFAFTNRDISNFSRNESPEFLAWLMAMTIEARESREAREAREAREQREARDIREAREVRDSMVFSRNPNEVNTNGQSSEPVSVNQGARSDAPVNNIPSNQPFTTNINTLVPDLRVAANQGQPQNRSPSVTPPPVRSDAIQIIPGLPDRNSGKIYSLQIGAFSTQDIANRTAGLLRGAGFEVAIEFSGAIYRVMATGISASDVHSASIRLGSLGFAQIWVRE